MTHDFAAGFAAEIEALETPSREMDARVWCALHGGIPYQPTLGWVANHHGEWPYPAPKLTASLDAVLVFKDELLPDYGCQFRLWDGRPSLATVWPHHGQRRYDGKAPLAPCALLAAVLRAVASMREADPTP
jgi:hypothetical protein